MNSCFLPETVSSLGHPDFERILKTEIEGLGMGCLPLQEGMEQSNFVCADQYAVIILNVSDKLKNLVVKAGISYAGLVAGCHCADDPTPMNQNNEYCEISVIIDKATSEAHITLLE